MAQAQVCLCASPHTHGHPCCAVERLFFDSLFLALFLSVCLLLFSSHFYLHSVLNLFVHVDNAKAIHFLRLRQPRCVASWPNSPLTQVMSPSSLMTSTTRRQLKSSSGTNPATKTRCPRTCLTRNLTMRPSGKRSLHHCSFRKREEPGDRR